MAIFNGTLGNDVIVPGTISLGVGIVGAPIDLTGDDTLRGIQGNDRMDGGLGNDFLDGSFGSDTLLGGEGDDSLLGSEDTDTLLGGAGNDTLNASDFSGADADSVNGGDGDDLLRLDELDRGIGGQGNDTFDLAASGVGLIDGGAGLDTLFANFHDISAATITGVETLADSARLTGAQLAGFTTVGTEGGLGFATFVYEFTETTTTANFTGKIFDIVDIYELRGFANNDRITFDANSTARARMLGRQGNDTLNGGGGRDTLFGDEGADVLNGGNGRDELYAGPINIGSDQADTLNGGAGDDFLADLGVGDRAFGGAGFDYFRVDQSGVAQIDGGLGTDSLQANGADLSGTTITGIEHLADSATMRAAQFNAFTRVGTLSPFERASYDLVVTDSGPMNLTGKIDDDFDFFDLRGVPGQIVANNIRFDALATNSVRMNGYEGDDSLTAGAGSDSLFGGDGADTLIGGNGSDTLIAGWAFNAADGADSLVGGNGGDFIDEIGAGDTALGGSGVDSLRLQEGGAAILDGGAGVDVLTASGLDLSASVVTGFERIWDSAAMTSAQSTQFQAFGFGSAFGRMDFFTYTFTTATNVIDLTGRYRDPFDVFTFRGSSTANNADTILWGNADPNDVALEGFGGNDSLRGGEGFDTLSGGEGNDTLDGGLWVNTIDGGNGTDTLTFANQPGGVAVDLTVVGRQAHSSVTFNTITSIENVIGTGFADTITAGSGNNVLEGGGGADVISGGAGGDNITGGDGNDTLVAGGGNDLLTGGTGADAFRFNPNGGFNTVFDFTDGQDRFQVSGFGAAFDTAAEVRAAAGQVGGGVQVVLGTTSVFLLGVTLASFTVADIDVV